MNASTKIALKIARGEWHPKGHDFCGVCAENKPEPEKCEPVSIECECIDDAVCEQPEPEYIECERIEQEPEPVKPAQSQAKQAKKARKRR